MTGTHRHETETHGSETKAETTKTVVPSSQKEVRPRWGFCEIEDLNCYSTSGLTYCWLHFLPSTVQPVVSDPIVEAAKDSVHEDKGIKVGSVDGRISHGMVRACSASGSSS